MSLYRQYLEESYKEYQYRIKTIVPLNNDDLDKIERILDKYDLKDMSAVRKTPLQDHPLEFYNERNKEVYILDVVLGMPASSEVIRNEIFDVLETYDGAVIVRADNDPIELYTDDINSEEETKTRLSTNEEYDDDEQIKDDPAYGDAYNERFLSRIARAKMKIDTDVTEDGAAYNKDMPGIKPVSTPSNNEEDGVAPTGNYDNERLKESKKKNFENQKRIPKCLT